MKMHEQYKRILKKHLYFKGALSVGELSQLTGKSLPYSIKYINELIAENEIVEQGLAYSSGGRRPQTYTLRQDLMYILSVAVDQCNTRIVLMDMKGTACKNIESIPLVLDDSSSGLEIMTSYICDYIKRSGIELNLIVGIGIGMPGFVDFNKGVNHSFFKEAGGRVVEYIGSRIGLPVLIDNDSSLIALAELRHGSVKSNGNLMVVNIGWGIGLGIILQGALFRGNDGFAGEFSHIPIFTNNKICSCGKMGCLETETSLKYIIQKAKDRIRAGEPTILREISLDHSEDASLAIMKAALEGDPFSIGLIAQAGYTIGKGISILAHLFNPGLIVLSGRGTMAGKIWLAPMQQAINEYCIPKIAENLEIKISNLWFSAELLGAADLVMEHYDKKQLFSKRESVGFGK